MNLLKELRNQLGVALYDWRRYAQATAQSVTQGDEPPRGWISVCNRAEKLAVNPSGPGVRCEWTWGSDLHACQVWPSLGRRLLGAALRDWPITFTDAPRCKTGPRLSFIFAHGGRDRLPQLKRTLRSLFAQSDVVVECVVIDQ